jgi:hypothetical protein
MKPLSIAEIERRFSAHTQYPTSAFTVTNTYLRKADELPAGGRGPNAPAATEKNILVATLGLVCSQQSKDVVEGLLRVRALKLDRQLLETEEGERTRVKEEDMFWDPGSPLEPVLLSCFKSAALNPKTFRLIELLVDHSTVAPKAQLSVREYRDEGPVIHIILFTGPDAPAGYQREAVGTSSWLSEGALMTMVDLYAINIQLPPANETGPSAGTDEPGSISPDVLIDRHRAPTRKRRVGS